MSVSGAEFSQNWLIGVRRRGNQIDLSRAAKLTIADATKVERQIAERAHERELYRQQRVAEERER